MQQPEQYNDPGGSDEHWKLCFCQVFGTDERDVSRKRAVRRAGHLPFEQSGPCLLRIARFDGLGWRVRLPDPAVGVPVERPECVETTALGAAYLAGLATGFWNGPAELKALAGWHAAVARVRSR